jgi:aspartyl-tRNA(Asn)/glutamyl-tRNA(Gln) amidotransferase subunit A
MADVMVSPAAVAGMPALNIFAEKNSEGLPVGVQIIGPRLKEEIVLNIGNKLEIKI